ncbi:MAG: ArnT family glycosyltransferase [Chloroflexota bacterium]
MRKQTILIFFALALLVLLARLPSLSMILDTDSSANAFFARQMLRGETLYDKYHSAHHLPGIYYTFLLAFQLFGDNPLSPRLLLFGFMIVNTWLVFLMGRDFFDQRAGMLGAVFYVLISSQVTLSGTSAEMEHFANLPLTATLFLALVLLRRNAPAAAFFGVGALGAICVLYKIIFVGSLAAAGLTILLAAWMARREAGNLKKTLARVGAVTFGFLLPLGLVGAYFASLGLWSRLLLVFTLGFTYFNDTNLLVGDVAFFKPFGFPLFMVAMNNLPLLVFGALGAFRLVRRSISLRTPENLVDLSLALWLVISFALAGLRGGGFAHYVLVVGPPLALVGGIEISVTYARWKEVYTPKPAWLGAGVMVALILGFYAWRNTDLYLPYIARLTGQQFKPTAYQEYDERQYLLSDYIAAHTSADDYIYVWSTNLQEFYYADRLPPTDILWPEYVSALGPPERIFTPRTKYIIVDDKKRRPQWLLDGLKRDYVLETVIMGTEIYRRAAP